jgi:hypothetical protein
VKNTNDGGQDSLRADMLAAGNGDTINFDPTIANKTITLTSGVISICTFRDFIDIGGV